jgi:NADPH2:quinone reductase
MRAIRVHEFGGPAVMKIETVPDPAAGPGQVVVRVRAVGINPVDTYIRSGSHAVRPQLPYTPGSDAAGEVESVGSGVTSVAAGDRVYVAAPNAGTYAERVVCGAPQVHRLTPRTTFGQGAASGVPYATVSRAASAPPPGRTVLVHARTASGSRPSMRARGLGSSAPVEPKGTGAVREHGADVTVNHHGTNTPTRS